MRLIVSTATRFQYSIPQGGGPIVRDRAISGPAGERCNSLDRIFFEFFALVLGGPVHISTNAEADISTPVNSSRFDK